MKEVSCQSEEFRRQLNKSMATAKGPKRDQLTVLATAIWFEEIRRMTRCSTYYAIERLFEPEAFGKNGEGDPYHRNKWAKYAVGLHQPSRAAIDKVDQKIPWASKLLKHPLWDVLRDIDGVNVRKEALLGHLEADIQRVVATGHSPWSGTGSRRELPLSRQLRSLEEKAGLDALACLSIMAAEALASEQLEEALKITSSIYRVLLITCIYMPFSNFQNELFDCFCERIISRVHDGKFRLGIEHVNFRKDVFLLSCLKDVLPVPNGTRVEIRNEMKACAKLLNGEFGYDAQFALNPPRVIWEEYSDASESDKQAADRSLKLRKWGESVLRRGEHEPFIPIEIL